MSALSSAIESPLVAGGARPSGDGPGSTPVSARADGVELLGRPGGSGYRRPPSLVRRADGQTVQLTPLLYVLLESIDGERGDDELAGLLGERVGKQVTAEDVRFLVERKLRPLGLLQEADGTAPAVSAPSPLLALRMKLVVSNPETTRRITALFGWLFHPAVVVLMVAAFAVTTWWLAFEKGLASAAHELLFRPTLVLVVVGLTLLSAGFHEIGHAAACRYGGARPGAMGVGLYLLWPAFYTDVSDSYRLGRTGRLRVDLGGLYFNAVYAVATLGVWALARWDALLLVIAAQLLLMVRQLMPFVRFDGYHILADLVGVPDLFMHIKPTLLGLLPRRRHSAARNPLKPWVRAFVTLWVVLVVPLLATFLVLMVLALPHVLGTAWASLGRQAHALALSWAAADAPTIAARLISMLLICLPIAGSVYLLVRVLRSTVRKVLRATRGKPLLRAGAGLVAALLGAGLAWAWWPGDSYRPIQPQDSGVLRLPQLAAPRQQPVARATPAAYVRAAAHVADRPAPPAQHPQAVRPARRRANGHPQWMVVLLPKRDAPAAARPTVSLPPPSADPPGAVPSVTPAGSKATATVTVVPRTKSGWVFPFAPPPKPGPRDNQALAVNTTDGATNYVVALSLVWVTDGGPVDERNDAEAFASCTGCTTVAVAFQAVFVVGYAQVVTPINTAVAANYDCNACATGALAQQLAITLTRDPSDGATQQIAALWSQLQQASQSFRLEPLSQVEEQLTATRSQLLDILSRDGVLPAPATTTSTTQPTATTTSTGTATTVPTTETATTQAATTPDATTTAPTTTDTTTTAPTTPPPPPPPPPTTTTTTTTTGTTTTGATTTGTTTTGTTTTAPATTTTDTTTTAPTTTTTPGP